MSEFVTWTGKSLSRKAFLRRSATVTFGLFAGLAVGVPKAFAYPCCTGPYGSGRCAAEFCTAYACHSHDPDTTCYNAYGFCRQGSNCWTTDICANGSTCCDCHCVDNSSGLDWYCFCNG